MDINREEMSFPEIETSRLKLRRIVDKGADELYKNFGSEEAMQYYGMYPHSSIDETKALVERFDSAFLEGRTVRWGIQLQGEDILMGTCGFHNWNKANHRIEIGYELCKEYRGNGYMAEALAAIIDYAFECMNINRIEAVVNPENLTSQKSLERLQFSYEGLLKEYAYQRDEFVDLCMYARVKGFRKS